MLLGEPPPSPGDLHFRIFGFPVRVHPFFWLVAVVMALGPGKADPKGVLIWVAVVFVSVLLHELGHATMQRFYGGSPWITLYGLGGLASCRDGPRSPGRRILILLAGPGAGFLLAALIIAVLKLSGFGFDVVRIPRLREIWETREIIPVSLIGPYAGYFDPLKSPLLNTAVAKLIYINIIWGLINLLPVYPLDGGQIARELFNLQNPRNGVVLALQVSAATAILVAVYALLNERFYVALLFGYLAYGNFQSIQFSRNNWR